MGRARKGKREADGDGKKGPQRKNEREEDESEGGDVEAEEENGRTNGSIKETSQDSKNETLWTDNNEIHLAEEDDEEEDDEYIVGDDDLMRKNETSGSSLAPPAASNTTNSRRKRKRSPKSRHSNATQQRPSRLVHDWLTYFGALNNNNDRLVGAGAPTTNRHHHRQAQQYHRISSLYHQLSILKDQLKPAAEAAVPPLSATHDLHAAAQNLMEQGRTRCNPYDCLGRRPHPQRAARRNNNNSGLNTYFLNRSALKLVNLFQRAMPCYPPNLSSFVDLCGAPGGFTEAIFFMHQNNKNNKLIRLQGYGMSLAGTNLHGAGSQWRLQRSPHLKPYFKSQNNPPPLTDNTNTPNPIQTNITKPKNTTTPNNNQHSFRISWGQDGTGDIYHWDNVVSLRNLIHTDQCPSHQHKIQPTPEHSKNTPQPTNTISPTNNDHQHNTQSNAAPHVDNNTNFASTTAHALESPSSTNITSEHQFQGVDLVLADGGFDAQRDCNTQEELSYRIVVCQLAAALTLVRDIIIIKVLGCRLPATRRVLTSCAATFFDRLEVYKPVVSRPASSERYVVFRRTSSLPPETSHDDNSQKSKPTTQYYHHADASKTQRKLPLSLEDALAWRDYCLGHYDQWNNQPSLQTKHPIKTLSTEPTLTMDMLPPTPQATETTHSTQTPTTQNILEQGNDNTIISTPGNNFDHTSDTSPTHARTFSPLEEKWNALLLSTEEFILELNTAACQDLLSYLQNYQNHADVRDGDGDNTNKNNNGDNKQRKHQTCYWPQLQRKLSLPTDLSIQVQSYRQSWRLTK